MNLKKSLKSFKYAFKGLKYVFQENNSWVHLIASIGAIVLGFSLKINALEWLWVLFAIALVWITETINTAIEKLTDLVSPDYHPLAGKVKDLAAAAVLIASMFALAVAFLVFLKYV